MFDGNNDNRAFRLITLLSDGTDHIAARAAIARDWPVAAPLPFGRRLNTAINAQPKTGADARAILAGEAPTDPAVRARAEAIDELAEATQVLELADEDAVIEAAFLAACDAKDDPDAISDFTYRGSRRAAVAGRILIEQSDVLLAVYDGEGTANPGGTGHTALLALQAGVPVIWIDPDRPHDWRILQTPEHLGDPASYDLAKGDLGAVDALVADTIGLEPPTQSGIMTGVSAVDPAAWRDSSTILSDAYRRTEALFGQTEWARKFSSVRQEFEMPEAIADGSGKSLVTSLADLAGQDSALIRGVRGEVLPRFAWTDGIATRLSDLYRSGMVLNFTLGATAIIAGVLYLPLVDTSKKWIFAAIELVLLLVIVGNTLSGQRARLHGRWLETRRAAEYLRHSPALLALGIARPVGAWPLGLRSAWPEWYAKGVARQVGLPAATIDTAYLRKAATALRDEFIVPQREYHTAKSERLHRAHHSIEHLAERMFALAIIAVATYLVAYAISQLGLIDENAVTGLAKWFTVIAVALPTMSGALAAIGYFADFDRFADVSRMTAERLEALERRVEAYLTLPDRHMTYAKLADLARLTDETTFSEIQAWQAVFSGKRTTVPA